MHHIISLEILQEWEQQSTFGSSRKLKRQQGSIGRRCNWPLEKAVCFYSFCATGQSNRQYKGTYHPVHCTITWKQ
ncbi:hypothetical protein BDL97_05G122200 [Sphagnum fallax]|nr:hypothetical protein BDL97_05G122200 [Sphagnum fallax]